MTKLNISPDFTIDDIHKIREYNYERRKNMSFEEHKKDVQVGANKILDRIANKREEKQLATL